MILLRGWQKTITVNGERPTDITEIPYDATSAKFDLGSRLGFGYGDGLENVGDDFRLYRDGEGPGSPGEFKSFVDGSLPGGTNYREVVFRWDNAPTTHDFGHFVDAPDQIAHALIRDRKLADGTDALYILNFYRLALLAPMRQGLVLPPTKVD